MKYNQQGRYAVSLEALLLNCYICMKYYTEVFPVKTAVVIYSISAYYTSKWPTVSHLDLKIPNSDLSRLISFIKGHTERRAKNI